MLWRFGRTGDAVLGRLARMTGRPHTRARLSNDISRVLSVGKFAGHRSRPTSSIAGGLGLPGVIPRIAEIRTSVARDEFSGHETFGITPQETLVIVGSIPITSSSTITSSQRRSRRSHPA